MSGGELRVALVAATDHALAGAWERAHEIVQQHEDDRHACWIHAVVHRVEGDIGNARYWYRRAGRTLREELTPRAELEAIRAELGVTA